MQISKKKLILFILSFSLFVVVFLTLNEAINFAMKPYEGSSERIWKDFYCEQNIDMVYLGSSIGNRAYDPDVVDSYTGLKSFNLSSNSQSLIASYWGLERAIKTNPVKYVILNIDYSSLRKYEILNAKVSYVQALSQYDNLLSRLLHFSTLARECGLKKKESVNIFFPWIYNHVPLKRKTITANIRKKLDANYASDHPGSDDFLDRGHFVPRNGEYESVDLDKKAGTNSTSYYKINNPEKVVSQDHYKNFDKIISLCRDNHVQLIVTFAPRPAFDTLSLGNSYFEINDFLRRYFKKQGIPFFDFNMLRKDFWTNDDKYYYDFEHMNQYGAESYSAAFARFFNMLEAGENVAPLFYSPEEYLASIDYIGGVLFQADKKNDSVSIHISSYQGTGVHPEYEVQLFDNESKGYITLRDFSTESEYEFRPAQKGKYKIRINARRVGSTVPYERYCEKSIDF